MEADLDWLLETFIQYAYCTQNEFSTSSEDDAIFEADIKRAEEIHAKLIKLVND